MTRAALVLLLVACGSPPATLADAGEDAAAVLPDLGAGPDLSAPPLCAAGTKAGGQYCGNDEISNGAAATLYTCPGPSAAPVHGVPCATGCVIEPPGTQDHCATPAAPSGYRLPWTHGVDMSLTQDCNDSCCNDHVGNDAYAWDFANGTSFVIRAARGGTITHLKLSSSTGCATSVCSPDANLVVVDHGDGTEATYLHLLNNSAQTGIACGAAVVQGQPLALAGTTGHSTGLHLHFQVSAVHAGAATCECGANGLECAGDTNPFGGVWVDAAHPTLPIAFDEWPTASTCADRRITMPPSLN